MSTPRTALLGGSFNPPHLAHLLAAAAALEQPDCEECWLVPVAGHPFGKDVVSFEERQEMCEAMIAPFAGRLGVCPIERELDEPSYTVRTLRALHERHPGRAWAWIIGSDNIADLGKWKDVDALFDLAQVWVAGRGGAGDGESPYAGRLRRITEADLPAISSTDVRRLVGEGQPVRGLVVDAVARRIEEQRLYQH